MSVSLRTTLATLLILAALFGGAWLAQGMLALMGQQVTYWPMFALNALYTLPITQRILHTARNPRTVAS